MENLKLDIVLLDDVDRENPDHIYQFGKFCLGR